MFTRVNSAATRAVRRKFQQYAMRTNADWSHLHETRMNPVYPSPWNKWFPHEPVPSTPRIGPYKETCFKDEVYYFCTCGESADQPWCQSGAVCNVCPDFRPRPFEPRLTGSTLFCGCKKSPDVYCNGACTVLWCDLNPGLASVASAAVAFVVGIVSTWLYQP